MQDSSARSRLSRTTFVHLTLLAALSALALAGCKAAASGPTPPTPPPPPPPTIATVDLTPGTATLDIGAKATLTATPRDASGNALTGRIITWNSSVPAVATVAAGVVTAVAQGNTTITATSEGKSATAAITVNPAPHPCVAGSATGRLTYASGDNSMRYVSHGGWTIIVIAATITIVEPAGHNKLQNWGYDNNTWHAHENINGKHVKDFVGFQRTHILSDSSKITINGRLTPQTSQITLYDNDQTHRFIIHQTNDTYEMVWSCGLPMFGDTEEHDGETSRLYYDDVGMLWYNIYQEDADANGVPQPRQHGNEPLARTYFANPNTTTDYYDDPRIGHT